MTSQEPAPKPFPKTIKVPSDRALAIIREQFEYDPLTGVVMRTTSFGRSQIKDGTYVFADGVKSSVKNHQIAWFLSNDEWPTQPIDHEDRNHKNNRLKNLRLATYAQNVWNRGKTRPSVSRFLGVQPTPQGAWRAVTKIGDSTKHIGVFETEEAAARAYDAFIIERRGEFAVVNFSTQSPTSIDGDTPYTATRTKLTRTAEERFWAKVHKNGPTMLHMTTACWEWTGTTASGYGSFYLNKALGGDIRNHIQTHRYSYQLANGQIPKGLCVLHCCDNKRCVNPTHLRLGTPKENANDRKLRGRTGGPPRKLTSEQEDAIRLKRQEGATYEALAAEYGVSQWLIADRCKDMTVLSDGVSKLD